MWRKFIGILAIVAFLPGIKASAVQYAFQVSFRDKNNTPYSLSSPLAYLSPRAVARRTHLGIAIDSTDLPVNQAYVDSVLTLTGGKIHESSRWLNLCVVLLSDSTAIHNLDGKPFIAGTKLIGYYATILHEPVGTTSPADHPVEKTLSANATFYGNTWFQTSLLNGNYLYDHGFDGAGKLIAVIDAGFSGTDTHPGFDSLRLSGRLADWHNFTLATDNIYAYDDHGTKVLSTMAGCVPGTFVGSAPRATYALYISEDDNSEQPIELVNMLAAAERADSIGADIITTSLGYNTFDNPLDNFVFATDFDGKSTTAARAANMATQKGILFIATAGNEGGNSWNMILTPGDADSALTIGSVDMAGSAWYTSGWGPNAAGQVKPDVCAFGHSANIFTATGYGQEDGTSFATPQIAGWAACLWQANPSSTPFMMRQAIIRCASHYSAPDGHNGYGIPNFQCTEQVLSVIDTPAPFSGANLVSASPSPFTNNLQLAFSPSADGNINFTITDMAGKTVSSFQIFASKGYNEPITIPLSTLPTGLYILKAVSSTQQQTLRLMKQ